MQSAKINIKKIVKTYIQTSPEEYDNFKHAMNYMREKMSDKKFGTTSEQDGGMRALYEMPVTLHEMLVHNLTEDQLAWLKRGGENGLEGGRWFANTFPEFRLPTHV